MIATIARVLRGEGAASAGRRAAERVVEWERLQWLRTRGLFRKPERATIVNVHAQIPAARHGGVPIQLRARLREEARQRPIALLYPGVMESDGAAWRAPQFAAATQRTDEAFERAVAEGLCRTGATTIVVEGTAGIPIGSLLRLIGRGVQVVLSLHDFSLLSADVHLPEAAPVDAERRELARALLQQARAVIGPSEYLLRRHRELLALDTLEGTVIAPGVEGATDLPVAARDDGVRRVAFVGSVTPHKGSARFGEIIGRAGDAGVEWHLFGGGEVDALRALRRLPKVTVHGYYRAGTLPRLLARHGIGLTLLPSAVPESFGLTLSESWLASIPAVAFDRGAHGERIRRDGGGWLVDPADGADGFARIVRAWAGGREAAVPRNVPRAKDAAEAHLALYRSLRIDVG